MAEDKFPPPPFLETPVKTPDKTPTVPTDQIVRPVIYANTWQMQLGESEMTITLGVTGSKIDNIPGSFNPVTSIALSHSQFVKLAAEFHRATMILQKMYGGAVPRISDLTNDRLKTVAAEVDQEIQNIASEFKNK